MIFRMDQGKINGKVEQNGISPFDVKIQPGK